MDPPTNPYRPPALAKRVAERDVANQPKQNQRSPLGRSLWLVCATVLLCIKAVFLWLIFAYLGQEIAAVISLGVAILAVLAFTLATVWLVTLSFFTRGDQVAD